ncbi:MAG: enoyl-CoA hydratase-related protein [Acidimicrobiia bacterium]|nr:enoyl-CoA hydratase-related protein [Acidimicrobiia bacterium]
MSDLLHSRSDHVVTLTLNRPERLNAISPSMMSALSERLMEADRDPDVRCVVLTGAGEGFSTGLDLKDFGNATSGGSPPMTVNEHPPVILRRMDTPTICALNGAAAGYGMDTALGCDMVIASDRAKLVFPVRRGVVPESGSTWILPRMLGWRKASEVLLLGRPLDTPQMLELGLVNRVVSHDDLLGETKVWAGEIAANAPLAMAATKRAMRLGLDSTFDANANQVMAEVRLLLRTHDFAEGLAAFKEKPRSVVRRPVTF